MPQLQAPIKPPAVKHDTPTPGPSAPTGLKLKLGKSKGSRSTSATPASTPPPQPLQHAAVADAPAEPVKKKLTLKFSKMKDSSN